MGAIQEVGVYRSRSAEYFKTSGKGERYSFRATGKLARGGRGYSISLAISTYTARYIVECEYRGRERAVSIIYKVYVPGEGYGSEAVSLRLHAPPIPDADRLADAVVDACRRIQSGESVDRVAVGVLSSVKAIVRNVAKMIVSGRI